MNACADGEAASRAPAAASKAAVMTVVFNTLLIGLVSVRVWGIGYRVS
jgi:hypothetical protein